MHVLISYLLLDVQHFTLILCSRQCIAFRDAQVRRVIQTDEVLGKAGGIGLCSPESLFAGLHLPLLVMKSCAAGMGFGLSAVSQPCGTWRLPPSTCSPGCLQMLLI